MSSLRPEQALTAAASVVRFDDRRMLKALADRVGQDWQRFAWDSYDQVPELRYGVDYHANALSQLRIFAAKIEDPREEPVETDDAAATDALERLRTDAQGHQHLLFEIGVNLQVAGECWLLGLAAQTAGDAESWEIRSVDEIEFGKNMIGTKRAAKLKYTEDGEDRQLGEEDFLARLFVPHPRRSFHATSNVRALLQVCEEIVMLQKEIRSVARSRSHNGILFIPEEITPYPLQGVQANQTDPRTDPFLGEMENAFITPIQDEGAASAVMPFLLRGKGELGALIQHIKLGRDYDEFIETWLDLSIRRLARGINLPPEVITGKGDTSHWNAWEINEDIWRLHVRPTAITAVDAITKGYLRPTLKADNRPDADEYVVWFDAEEMLRRPLGGEELNQAHDRIVISDAAYRARRGIPEKEAPDDAERVVRLLLERGSVAPEITQAIIDKFLEPLGVVPSSNGNGSRPAAAPEPSTDQPGPPALRAAVDPTMLGERLARIDQPLYERILSATDSALRASVKRTGNQIRAAAHNDPKLRSVAHGPGVDVARALGPGLIAALGIEPDGLLVEDLSDLQTRFDRWVADAQERALREISNLVGDVDLDAVRRVQTHDRDQAWRWLLAELASLGSASLADPIPLAGEGEFDTTLTVPFVAIREAIARAGGAEDGGLVRQGSWLSLSGTRPAGGIATGWRIEELLRTAGYSYEAWQWEYGLFFRSREFEPHRRLDGIVFSTFDDEVLRNHESFPPTPFYSPGDHRGCACNAIPVIATQPIPALGASLTQEVSA